MVIINCCYEIFYSIINLIVQLTWWQNITFCLHFLKQKNKFCGSLYFYISMKDYKKIKQIKTAANSLNSYFIFGTNAAHEHYNKLALFQRQDHISIVASHLLSCPLLCDCPQI